MDKVLLRRDKNFFGFDEGTGSEMCILCMQNADIQLIHFRAMQIVAA